MFFEVRLIPVLAAAVANFFIGMLWYSPAFFAKPWMKEIGMTEEKMKKTDASGMGVRMLVAFVTGFIMAYIISYVFLIADSSTNDHPIIGALLLWIGFVVPLQTSPVLWEGRGMRYWMINAGYWLVSILVMSLIITAFPAR